MAAAFPARRGRAAPADDVLASAAAFLREVGLSVHEIPSPETDTDSSTDADIDTTANEGSGDDASNDAGEEGS